MAWTPVKTWTMQEPLSFTDLNTYLRDNMQYLYSGLQHVIEQWVMQQTGSISVPTVGGWNNVNSAGILEVAVGEVAGADILDLAVAARCTNGATTNKWTLGVAIYDGTTLLRRYEGASASSGESMTLSGSHIFDAGYDDIKVYMTVKPSTAAGTLTYATPPDTYCWLNVTHKRPPA